MTPGPVERSWEIFNQPYVRSTIFERPELKFLHDRTLRFELKVSSLDLQRIFDKKYKGTYQDNFE